MHLPFSAIMAEELRNRTEAPLDDIRMPQLEVNRRTEIHQIHEDNEIFASSNPHF